jgi:hypothetical protein
MLRTDLLDVINSGDAWAFIGSGISMDSGYPSWGALVDAIVSRLPEDHRRALTADPVLARAAASREYAKCLGRIERLTGRTNIVTAFRASLNGGTAGSLVRRLVDWPFAGYVTTNYDPLLENALAAARELGWISVGNTRDEVRKVSGEARNLVWHVHGALGLPDERSHLVLTEADYDQFYLEGSPLLTQLRSLLSQRRVVFFGLGFEDPEVLRLLKAVGGLCGPDSVAFAFLSGFDRGDGQASRLDFLERFNVDIVPYDVRGGSHRQLDDILSAYGSLVLPRSLRFGQPRRPIPSYDPETTGLLVYNELVLRNRDGIAEPVLATILKSRILSLLKFRGPLRQADIDLDLAERARLAAGVGTTSEDATPARLTVGCLSALVADGLVEIALDGTSTLTPEGLELLTSRAAVAGRSKDQFHECLRARALLELADDTAAAERVLQAADAFFKDLVRRRALGVAMALFASDKDAADFHFVALLQSLPTYMKELTSPKEALALTRVIRGLLAQTNDFERKYIGAALQAQFGVALLGFDPDTVRVRASEFEHTLFLLDASTLIPALGRSSVGHAQARLLLDGLKGTHSPVATTPLFVDEIAEHARWAVRQVGVGGSSLNLPALAAAAGRAGARSNVFLDGFLREVASGTASPDLGEYLVSVCGERKAANGLPEAFLAAIRNLGIAVKALGEWDGFSEVMWHEREVNTAKIAEARQAKGTYSHDRQAKAEAEALMIVEKLREGTFAFDSGQIHNAFFISNSRIIDRIADARRPVTIRPEAVAQWLSTVSAIDVDELAGLTDGLLWELAERGLSVVDSRELGRSFSPFISASRLRLEEELRRHRELTAQLYGEEPRRAFGPISDLEAPFVFASAAMQRAESLEKKVKELTTQKLAAQRNATITDKERSEAAAFRELKARKRREAAARKRAAASRKLSRRRRKARK